MSPLYPQTFLVAVQCPSTSDGCWVVLGDLHGGRSYKATSRSLYEVAGCLLPLQIEFNLLPLTGSTLSGCTDLRTPSAVFVFQRVSVAQILPTTIFWCAKHRDTGFLFRLRASWQYKVVR